MTTTALERPSKKAVQAQKPRRAAPPGPRGPHADDAPPSYHSDISDEYLSALQRWVDAQKPKVFKLTPINEPGW